MRSTKKYKRRRMEGIVPVRGKNPMVQEREPFNGGGLCYACKAIERNGGGREPNFQKG